MAPTTDSTPLMLGSACVYTAANALPGFNVTTNAADTVWPAAGLALYIPLLLPFTYSAQRAWLINGGVVSGNVDIGVYNSDFSQVAHTGNFAQAGVTGIQYVTFAQTLQAGLYYLGISCSSGTAQVFCRAQAVTTLELVGVLQQSAANPLPAPAVPVKIATTQWPLFGLTRAASGF